ncbi:MAG: ATP-binding protein [Actinomycetes bacterium]
MNGQWSKYRSWWLDGRAEHGRWVTSWQIWLAFLPLGWSSLFVNVFNGDSRATARACVVGLVVSGLVLWLASLTILRNRRIAPVDWRWVAITWFVAGVAMYVSALFLNAHMANSVTPTLEQTVAVAIRFGLIYMFNRAVAVGIVTFLALGRRRLIELAATREELELTLSEVESYIAATKERYVSFVASSIRPRIRQIQRELARTVDGGFDSESLESLVLRFDQLTNDEVRPLSHSLASREFPGVTTSSGSTSIELTDGDGIRPVLSKYVPSSIPIALVLGSVGLGWLLSRPQTAVVPLSNVAVVWPIICVAVARVIIRWRNESNGQLPPVYVAMTILAIVVGLTRIAVEAFGDGRLSALPGLDEWQTFLLRLTAMSTAILVVTALGWAASYLMFRQQVLDASVRRANAQLEQIILSREIESEQIRQSLAHLVHGPIQGRLALATMILRRLRSGDGSAVSVEAGAGDGMQEIGITQVEELLDLIEEDLDRLPGMIETRSLTGYLRDAAQEMRGLTVLTWTESPDCGELVQANLGLDRRLTMVVEEVIGNAFKHGRAEHIHVWLDVAQRSPLTIEVTVTDDGVGVSPTATAGLGERMFSALSDSWELKPDVGGGTVFWARVTDRSALHSYA